jgi:hypothetical protein
VKGRARAHPASRPTRAAAVAGAGSSTASSSRANTPAQRAMEDGLERLTRGVEFIRKDLDAYNAGVPGRAEAVLPARKEELLKRRDVTASLGVPIRTKSTTTPTVSVRAPENLKDSSPSYSPLMAHSDRVPHGIQLAHRVIAVTAENLSPDPLNASVHREETVGRSAVDLVRLHPLELSAVLLVPSECMSRLHVVLEGFRLFENRSN